MRHRAARQTCASTTRYNGCIDRMAGLQYGLDLRVGFWQNHTQGTCPISCEAITFVRDRIFGGVEHRMRRQDTQKRSDHLGLALSMGHRL